MSKNFKGGLKHKSLRPREAKCFEDSNKSRCLVTLLQKYCSLCPDEMLDNGLFLSPFKSPSPAAKVWYRRQYIGHNTLKNFVSTIMKEGGLYDQGHFTNHSLRASTATRLFRKGVDEQLIAEQTGHRSLSALRRYKRPDLNLKAAVSDVLQGKMPIRGVTPRETRDKSPITETVTAQARLPESDKKSTNDCSEAKRLRLESMATSEKCTLNIYGGNFNLHFQ